MFHYLRLFGLHLLLSSFVYSTNIYSVNNKMQMINDLDLIKTVFSYSYAPADWKRHCFDWDLEVEINDAKEKIEKNKAISTKDYQRIVKDFMLSTKDYHVSIRFYSTEWAYLPFKIKGANGRFFFSYIDRDKLSSTAFPFYEGDELLLIDSMPIGDAINQFRKREIGDVNENTDRALAEYYFTHRFGILGHAVPKGPVTITILPSGSSTPSSYQLIWNYKPEKITDAPKAQAMHSVLAKSQKPPGKKITKRSLLADEFFQKKLLSPFFEPFADNEDQDQDESPIDFLGTKKSFVPPLGKIWWEVSDYNAFHAYLFELPGRKLAGYVRIPTYMPFGGEVEDFAEIIEFLEDHSDALVIDQVDNPGGSVFYLYALASMLSDQPLKTPRHRMTITQSEVYFAVQMIPLFESIQSDDDAEELLGETFQGFPITHQMAQFFLNFFYFIVDEWNSGRQFTEPFYLYGIDHINPSQSVRYTKPILLLVNSLDFSGGDFFPAILQDNNRVIVMGTKTAGAGGFVSRLKFPNLNGIHEIRFTSSIAERLDKTYIENKGVTPDIPYEISVEDLQYNYKDFVEAVRGAVEDLIQDD